VARAFRPDVAVVRYEAFEWQMWIVCAVLGIPMVVEVNATTRELAQWKREEIYVYPFTRQLERAVLRRADRVFGVSTTLKRLLVEDGLDPERIAVVPNGADPEKFSPAVSSTHVRRRYGLGRTVVGFLGSAAGTTSTSSPINPRARGVRGVRFSWPGRPLDDLSPRQREVPRAGGSRRLHGCRALDGWSLRRGDGCRLTLFPSLNFAIGDQVVQYMAAGQAAWAAIGQQAEILRDHVNGILIEPGDGAALGTAIDELIADPALRRRLGEAARATILAEYSWRHNAQRVTDVCVHEIRERSGLAAMHASPEREVRS
jgi:glycosyltransferase involved in cell wall biosynthesis